MVHVVKEVFVTTFSWNYETDYGAKPVFVDVYMQGGALTMMQHLLWGYSARHGQYGKSLHGPLSSIASDSDAKCHLVMFQELMPADPVFKCLCNLPGLNLWNGSVGETQDLSY